MLAVRELANFKTVFEALGMAAGQFTPEDIAASPALDKALMAVFNRAYQRGYGMRVWEDALEAKTVTPVNRFVDFSAFEDARRFSVWTADPRDWQTTADEIYYSTYQAGLQLATADSSVCILYQPTCPKFTRAPYNAGTAYTLKASVLATDGNCYRCIQASTGQTPQTSPSYWELVPLLAVLEEFTAAYASGTHELEKGNQGTGAARRSDALTELEIAAQAEYTRTARSRWRPKF